MRDNRIRRVMDESLADMTFTDAQRQRVLEAAKGEKIVKKKISAALVFALVLVLATGMSMAVLSLRDMGRQVIELEQTEGYYIDWSAERKTSLVRSLVQMGYIEETDGVRLLLDGGLSEEEASLAADAIMEDFTGWHAYDISFLVIMQAAWGPFEQWTLEQQAWYSQQMIEMGIQKGDHTLYVMPGEDIPIGREQAIAIARREIAKAYEVAESDLADYEAVVTFQVPEDHAPGDDQPWWAVDLVAPEDMPQEERLFSMFWALIHPETGELRDSLVDRLAQARADEAMREEMMQAELYIQLQAISEEYGYNMGFMTHEGRAKYSEVLRPLAAARQAEDPERYAREAGISLMATFRFVYGVPDDTVLPEADALALAQRALVAQMGLDEAEIPFFSRRMQTYFDVTDPARPLWKFFFWMPSPYDPDDDYVQAVKDYYGEDPERMPNYKVELDARTGEVVRAFGIDLKDVDTLEAFEQLY